MSLWLLNREFHSIVSGNSWYISMTPDSKGDTSFFRRNQPPGKQNTKGKVAQFPPLLMGRAKSWHLYQGVCFFSSSYTSMTILTFGFFCTLVSPASSEVRGNSKLENTHISDPGLLVQRSLRIHTEFWYCLYQIWNCLYYQHQSSYQLMNQRSTRHQNQVSCFKALCIWMNKILIYVCTKLSPFFTARKNIR